MQTTLASSQPAHATGTAPAARIIGGTKIYGTGSTAVRALDGISAEFAAGAFTAIMGPSGSGKSTLLHCLAGLDRLTSGQVMIGDDELSGLDDKAMTLLRRERIGFVFQAFNLVPTLTARENVILPLTLGGKKPDPAWLAELAAALGITDRLAHRPTELSGGQQQRVATARALITRPDLIFADEPTGNLDSRSAAELLTQIRRAVDGFGQTVVMVTHDPLAAGYADRVLFLADGRVVRELPAPTADRVLDVIRGWDAVAMWGITLKGILAHRVRYALTALAVLLGVSFISGTFVLTDTMNGTFNGLYQQIYQGTAAVVRATQPFDPGLSYTLERQRIDASLAGPVSKVPGVRAVALDIEGYAQLVGKSGKPIGVASNGPPMIGMAWSGVAGLSPLRLVPGGQPPRGPGQVVIDEHSARIGHFKVGDKVRILTKVSPGTYTITGLATWGTADSPLGASIAAFTPVTAARVLGQPGKVSQLDVAAEPGVSQDTLVARVRAAIHDPGIEVVSGQSVTAEGQQSVHQALSFIGTFLLTFGFIALFVGAFVIFNTFSIVVAQRLRELALLRAVGASRRQVFAAILGESLVIGLTASAAGVVAGIGLAVALKAGLSALGMDLPATSLVVSPRTAVVGLLAGVAVTVVSAIAPALRAARIPPVAALQDVAAEPRRPLVRRTAVGVVFTFVGLVVLGACLFSHLPNRMPLVGAGASALFIGIAALGPFIARPVCRLLGAPLAWFGASGKLGQQNAMRSPSRAAATAAALMVGVSLVSMTTVMASSVKASANSVIDSALRADFVVSSGAAVSSGGAGGGFSPAVERSIAALPGVADVAGIRSGIVKVFGRVTPVVAADPAKAAPLFNLDITQGSLAGMTPTGIGVSTQAANDRHLRLGSPVTLVYPTTGTKTYTVQVIYRVREIAGDYVLPIAAAQANFSQALDVAAFVQLAPGVSAGAARSAIERVLAAYPNVTLQDQAQYKAQQAQQVNQLLNLVYGLLALAVLIALIGIANTLALSIYERTHELGLLRAVGATRGQLRAIVRYESLVISLFGAVEGLALGTLFGWAIVAVLHSQGVTRLVFPVTQLVMLAVLAGVAGLVAALAPSRRAARLNILQAVTTE